MLFIRQNATHKVVIGPVVAVANGYVPVTTLSLSGADEAEAILHDNGTVVDISGYTFAAITTADGYYHLTLQSGISGTVGHMTVVINDDSLCLPVKAEFTVLEEAVYDQYFAASAAGAQVPIWSSAGATVNLSATTVATVTTTSTATAVTTVNGIAAGAITAAAIADGAIDAATFAAGAINAAAIADGAIDAATFASDVDAEILSYIVDDATRIDASSLNTATVTSIPAITTELAKVPKSDGTATWNATALAAIQAEANDALVANNLDHLVLSAVDTNFATTVHANSVIGHLADNGAGFDRTTDSLEAIRDQGDAAWSTVAAAAVRSAVGLASDNLDTQLSGIQSDTNDIQTRIPAALTGAGNIKADVIAVDGDTDAADRLQRVLQGNVLGTVGAASTTTSVVTSALSPAAAVTDQFKGRILTFKNDTTTANLRGQSTDITASTSGGVLTVTALTTAPASGDTFTIS